MSSDQEVVALSLSEIDPKKLMFSAKETKSWNFLNKKNNKQTVGSNDWVEVWYENKGQKLAFVLENVKTNSGIQSTDSFKRGFMSVNLTDQQSKDVKKYIDDYLLEMAFQHREELFKPGRKMTHKDQMMFLYRGIVKAGEEKTEKSDKKGVKGPVIKVEGKPTYWNDSVTGNIPMKKRANQVVVDETQCQVVDLDGRPYAWSSLDNKNLREVIVEVEKLVFSDKVTVHLTFRCIVPNEVGSGGVKYTTKRRLEQEKSQPDARSSDAGRQGGASSGGDGGDDKQTSQAYVAAQPTATVAPSVAAAGASSEPPPAKRAKAV